MKILYVTTVSDTMGFFIEHIKMLIKEGHTVDMACNIGKPINQELINLGCNVFHFNFSRSPLKFSNYFALKNLKRLIREKKYDIVHTHTPVASVCSRIACKSLDNVKMVYTAHGFHFYTGAPLKNWIIYYPIEKWLSKYTDVLITINKEDYARACSQFNTDKVEFVPGVGLDTKKISQVKVNKMAKRKGIGIPEDAIVLLSVGELNKNKNHETVIKSIAKLNNQNIYYIICGEGPLKGYLKNLIKDLGIERQVNLLGFRNDIHEIYNISDLFVFPSYREGLSVALMEAMAFGLPVVCSKIRGNTDLVYDEKGGLLVNSGAIDEYSYAISKLINDEIKRENMGIYNTQRIKNYDINNVLDKLNQIISSVNRE